MLPPRGNGGLLRAKLRKIRRQEYQGVCDRRRAVEQSRPRRLRRLRSIYGFRQDIFYRPPEIGAKVFQFRAKAECKFPKYQVVQRNFQESQARRRAGLGNCIEIGN